MAKILIVEDDPMQRKDYALFLESKDGGFHEVDEAGSATTAVDLIKNNPYDLILLDIMMAFLPEDEKNKDINDFEVDYGRKMGLYVYKKARAMQNPPPIALISVVDDYSVLSEFPEAVGYLHKYFEEEELFKLVLHSLENAK